ncbi:helix-turn-helix transcriptional regulator [Xanthomonas arboricola pv. corylina]|uniref:helix-turn-helix transcriptional regulator n=1 Tax=Xanthomonas arboricola TaxID=56448 RepID=UPI0011B0B54C|nr:helix-turn-helix transcriptional regulator [Xanthomonas arboricola]
MGIDPIPFRIDSQSRSAFHSLNAFRHHADMDRARKNVMSLMTGRSVKAVGEGSGVGQTWLQRWLNPDSPSGIRKSNSEKMRQLAEFFDVDVERLMWSDLTEPSPAAQSQAVGRQRDMLRVAVRVVAIIKEAGMLEVSDDTYADVLYETLVKAQELGIGEDASELEVVRVAAQVANAYKRG